MQRPLKNTYNWLVNSKTYAENVDKLRMLIVYCEKKQINYMISSQKSKHRQSFPCNHYSKSPDRQHSSKVAKSSQNLALAKPWLIFHKQFQAFHHCRAGKHALTLKGTGGE